jgi:hypothetical protein
MKTREYSIRARGINDLNNRPDIWEQLRSLTVAIEEKMLAKRRSPYMGIAFLPITLMSPVFDVVNGGQKTLTTLHELWSS